MILSAWLACTFFSPLRVGKAFLSQEYYAKLTSLLARILVSHVLEELLWKRWLRAPCLELASVEPRKANACLMLFRLKSVREEQRGNLFALSCTTPVAHQVVQYTSSASVRQLWTPSCLELAEATIYEVRVKIFQVTSQSCLHILGWAVERTGALFVAEGSEDLAALTIGKQMKYHDLKKNTKVWAEDSDDSFPSATNKTCNYHITRHLLRAA